MFTSPFHALHNLAQRKGYAELADPSLRRIEYIVELKARPQNATVVRTLKEVGDKTYVPYLFVPGWFHERRNDTKTGLLIENIKGVGLAIGETSIRNREKNEAALEKKLQNARQKSEIMGTQFAADVQDCSEVTQDKHVRWLVQLLEHGLAACFRRSLSTTDLEELNVSGYMVFRAEGEYLHNNPVLHEYFYKHWLLRQQKGSAQKTTDGIQRDCVLSGQPIQYLMGNFPSITAPTGERFVLASRNMESFRHGSLADPDQAPMERKVAYGISCATQQLLLYNAPSYKTGQRMPERSYIAIGERKDQSYICFWPTEDDGDDAVEAIVNLACPPALGLLLGEQITIKPTDSERTRVVINLARSPNTGRRIPQKPAGSFCSLALSLNSSRAAITAWEEQPIDALWAHLEQHFDDIAIHIPGEPNFRFSWPALLYAVTPPGQKWRSATPQSVQRQGYLAALSGGLYPQLLYKRALARCLVPPPQAYKDRVLSGLPGGVMAARAAILRSYLNRQNRLRGDKEELTMALDPNNTNNGYLLGRWLSLAGQAQYTAYGQVDADVSTRFFRALQTNTQSAVRQLGELVPKHLQKIRKKPHGQARAHQIGKQISSVLSQLQPEKLPLRLTPVERSHFVLGWYHEQAAMFERIADSKKKDNNGAQTPPNQED